uniref:Multiple epidermal growth factor-like domains protein 11 isoform X1 n=1 Tax=Crassostrea virginica TaxID=6565 RepID=A0A8B8E5D9_CRAVI|nr:multiple epidermal growth factor-like domains protein 11 isoform X1 [Crassostrea virginica]
MISLIDTFHVAVCIIDLYDKMSVFMYDVCYGFLILICNSAFATNSSYCGLKGCCPNYRMVDGLCIACPKGTFGEDCSEECPTDKYGELCSNECHCRPTEPCDPIHGCINTEGTCNI